MGRVVLHLLILFSVVYTTYAGCTGFGGVACLNGGMCNSVANICECPAIWTGADCSTPEVLTVTGGGAVNEDAGTVSFTVTRTASFASLVVALTTAGSGANSATLTSDFTFASPSVTFAAGETSKSVDVTIIDDGDHEPAEELTLTVAGPPGSSIVSKTQTATINDNDVEVLTVIGGGAVNEDAGTVSFTVTRTASFASLVVALTAAGSGANSATLTSDFTFASPSVTFAAGETSKSVDVTIIDDGDHEPAEELTLTVAGPPGSSIVSKTQTATINDNDVEVLTVIGGGAVNEDAGTVSFTVTRTASFASLVVALTAAGSGANSATLTSDFTFASPSVTFAAGETSKSVDVTIIDDGDHEPAEELTLTVAGPPGSSIVSKTQTATINDNDVEVLTVIGGGAVNEDAGTVSFTVTRTASFASLVVALTAAGSGANSATLTSDFSFASPSVTFAAGETSKSVDVTIIDDGDHEPAEELTLTVAGPPGSSIVSKTQTATINDNDVEVLTVTGGGAVNEDAGTVSFTVTRTASFASLVVALTAAGSGANSATLTSDFTFASPSVTFAAGETSKSVDVTIIDDGDHEPAEELTLTVAGPPGSSIVSKTQTATINDNDVEVLTVTGGGAVNEDAGTVSFTVTRTASFASLVVALTAAGSGANSATLTSDFTFASPSVTFAAGETSKSVDVTIIDDGDHEPAEELTLTVAGPPGSSIVSKTQTATINDNDVEVLTVTGGGAVNEGAGTVSFTVTRTASFASLVVALTAAGSGANSATLSSDFTFASPSVTFAAGETSKSVDVTIIDDGDHEPAEELTLTVAGPPGSSIVSKTQTATINDNDVEVLTLTGPVGGVVDEAAGPATFTLTRTASFEALAVTVTAAGSGTNQATVVNDFTAPTSTVNFAVGETSKSIDVAIIDDSVAEPDEEFTLTVDAPGAIVDPTNVVTIVNDDPDVVTLPTFLASMENGGSKELTITRTVSDKAVTVKVNTADGTAKAGTDYTALSDQEVTFPVGALTTTFSVSITNDADDESDETFTLVVSGADVLTSPTYTFILVDDEGSREFDCRRRNQNCGDAADQCDPSVPLCECVGSPVREGDMCNVITVQKNGPACAGKDCNNNGVCLDNAGVTSCACNPGYYGDDCEHYFLSSVCTTDKMILIANPIGSFEGSIYVKEKYGVNACTANAVPNPANPSDEIDDNLLGYFIDVDHTSTDCGAVTPVENGLQTSYSRTFIIQYEDHITTNIDQGVTVTCSFENNVLVSAGAITVDPNVPFIEESTSGTFSPLTLGLDVDGSAVSESTVVALAKKLCVTVTVVQPFGGIEMIDIEFNNTLPADPKSWSILKDGCPETNSKAVFVSKPYYSIAGSKREMKFCFFTFKFVNSLKLTLQVKLKICVDSADCNLATCGTTRRKRQIESTTEEEVTTVFNINDPSTQSQTQTQSDDNSAPVQADCQLPLEFLPTVMCLGSLCALLALLVIFLTCRLVQRPSRRLQKKLSFSNKNFPSRLGTWRE